jgi:hypothetical protein
MSSHFLRHRPRPFLSGDLPPLLGAAVAVIEDQLGAGSVGSGRICQATSGLSITVVAWIDVDLVAVGDLGAGGIDTDERGRAVGPPSMQLSAARMVPSI